MNQNEATATADPPQPEAEQITCKWLDCHWKATSGVDEDLLEHIRACHSHLQPYKDRKAALDMHKGKLTSLPRDLEEFYICLWRGCRVYQKPSISKGWFERHILDHAGKRPFKCFFEGCQARFRRTGALDKHINSHFNHNNTASNNNNNNNTSSNHHHNHHHHHHHNGHHNHTNSNDHHQHNGHHHHHHRYNGTLHNGHHHHHHRHTGSHHNGHHHHHHRHNNHNGHHHYEDGEHYDDHHAIHRHHKSAGTLSRTTVGNDFFHEGIMEYITHYLLVNNVNHETLKKRDTSINK